METLGSHPSHSFVSTLIEAYPTVWKKQIMLTQEVAVYHGTPSLFRSMRGVVSPFILTDYRLGIVLSGEMRGRLNLQDVHLRAGDIVYIGPGTCAQPLSFTDDLEIRGVALFGDFPMPFDTRRMPEPFNGRQFFYCDTPSLHELNLLVLCFDLLWNLALSGGHPKAIRQQVGTVMQLFSDIYLAGNAAPATASRERALLNHFIRLVGEHVISHHTLDFYAEQLQLSPRYLGTLVHKISGQTAKEWLDQALVKAMKVQLCYADKPLKQISDELNFPNVSFFCKFFRRVTGQTPSEFRATMHT